LRNARWPEDWKIEDAIEGDIAGVYLEKRDIPPLNAKVLAKLMERTRGVNEQHLLDCASRARLSTLPPESRPVGVVVCAFETTTASAVRRALEKGLISRLIIGLQLARKL
jgi:hypothetical protein